MPFSVSQKERQYKPGCPGASRTKASRLNPEFPALIPWPFSCNLFHRPRTAWTIRRSPRGSLPPVLKPTVIAFKCGL
jgi:hypothetical protein